MNKTISVLFATTIFTAPVLADQLRVVVDIPPIHGIVDGVLGSNASITTLIGSGIDPHNYTMKPSHAAAVSEADLIVLIGEALTPSLAEKLPSLASNAKIIELAEVPNVHLIAYEDAHEKHEDDDDHDTMIIKTITMMQIMTITHKKATMNTITATRTTMIMMRTMDMSAMTIVVWIPTCGWILIMQMFGRM
jgi:ABC-type Zn uptake system ZnuABC Zn-binding protein ZnuA